MPQGRTVRERLRDFLRRPTPNRSADLAVPWLGACCADATPTAPSAAQAINERKVFIAYLLDPVVGYNSGPADCVGGMACV